MKLCGCGLKDGFYRRIPNSATGNKRAQKKACGTLIWGWRILMGLFYTVIILVIFHKIGNNSNQHLIQLQAACKAASNINMNTELWIPGELKKNAQIKWTSD